MSRKVKIALYQGFHGLGIPENIIDNIAVHNVDLLCLPEYFLVDQNDQSILSSAAMHDQHLNYLVSISIRLNCILTGSSLVKSEDGIYKNRCYFIVKSIVQGYYDKIHLYKNEGKGQIKPGYEYKAFKVDGLRIGLLVCADVLYPWSFQNIRGLKPDLLAIPVTSPYREGESKETKFRRDDELFVEGAKTAGCPLIKVGSVGNIAGHRLQGRSLAADEHGIIFRVAPEDEAHPLLKIINITL